MSFRFLLPATIVALGSDLTGEAAIDVRWKSSAADVEHDDQIVVRWNTAVLKARFAEIEDEVANLRERDENKAERVEMAAVLIAVGLLAHIEPESRFTQRSSVGTGHDYYLNDHRDQMIEIAGRSEGGLPGLFAEKRLQSDRNPSLRKRWVSVTIFGGRPRNRTEGLHS